MDRTNPRAPETQKFLSRDRELSLRMAKAQAGDEFAYRELLTEIQKMLETFIGKKLRSTRFYSVSLVEDLVQEVLIAIHEKRQTYDPSVPFGPWMFAIARYKLIDSLRKSRHEVSWESLEQGNALSVSAPETNSPGYLNDFQAIMEGLSEKQQAVLYQSKVEGLSMQEVSAATGMSESSVKVTLHRTLKLLKNRFRNGDRP